MPDLDHIALMWFDQYLKGMNTGAERVPNVTQYLYGEERYAIAGELAAPAGPRRAPGTCAPTSQPERASCRRAGEGSITVLQQPLNGICSPSTTQWTAGLLGVLPLPCFDENNLNENG